MAGVQGAEFPTYRLRINAVCAGEAGLIMSVIVKVALGECNLLY